MNDCDRPKNRMRRKPRIKGRLLIIGWLFAAANAYSDPDSIINTDPNKLVGKQILFFKLDHVDAKLLEPACVVPLTNGGLTVQWYNLVHNHPILNDPRYFILKDAESLHHYCRGQASKLRYFKERDPIMKRRLLENMVGEFVFMINNPQFVPKNWAYMKVMHLELGNARMLEKKPGMAMRSFEEALTLDPAYERAHVAYTDALTDMGLKDKALAQAIEGLKHNPDSKSLQRRYKELGGKLPFPEPYKETEPEAPKPAPDAPVAESGKTPDVAPVAPQTAPSPQMPAPEPALPESIAPQPGNVPKQEAEPAKPTVPAPQAVEGNKNGKNPYCRFCP